MKLAGAKVYAQTVRFRKALASSLYSRGYGELAVLDIPVCGNQGRR